MELQQHKDQKDFDKFKELMIEAIRLKPNDHILFFNLGVVNADQGNVEDARVYYEKAIEINPNITNPNKTEKPE